MKPRALELYLRGFLCCAACFSDHQEVTGCSNQCTQGDCAQPCKHNCFVLALYLAVLQCNSRGLYFDDLPKKCKKGSYGFNSCELCGCQRFLANYNYLLGKWYWHKLLLLACVWVGGSPRSGTFCLIR